MIKAIEKLWTEDKIKFLIENYSIKGKMFCCEMLGMKECQIRYKASSLKLRIDKNAEYLKANSYKKGLYFKGKKRPEHSVKMKQLVNEGRLKQFVKWKQVPFVKKCIKCGKEIVFMIPENSKNKRKLRSTCSEECYHKIISDKAKITIEKNGHPKGMLGKHHSLELREEMSKRSKNMWADKNSKFNSKELSQKRSDRNVLLHKQGILGGITSYSRAKKGWWDNGDGKRYFMRSSWETNYANYLDFLKKHNEIIDWEYEADIFRFDNIKSGIRTYKPDFKVYLLSGLIEYHEVKGWMDRKSKTKIKRFRKYYPEEKLIIIDETRYKSIMKNKNLFTPNK